MTGFTFPGFWMLHASGFWSVLYKPLQWMLHTQAVGWPSLITASLLYLCLIFCFEALRLLLANASRE